MKKTYTKTFTNKGAAIKYYNAVANTTNIFFCTMSRELMTNEYTVSWQYK